MHGEQSCEHEIPSTKGRQREGKAENKYEVQHIDTIWNKLKTIHVWSLPKDYFKPSAGRDCACWLVLESNFIAGKVRDQRDISIRCRDKRAAMICQLYLTSIEAPKKKNGIEKRKIRIARMTTTVTRMTAIIAKLLTVLAVEETNCDKIKAAVRASRNYRNSLPKN